MKMRQDQNGAGGIPMEAMKDVTCKCGGKLFGMLYHVKYYPGGLYSTLPVAVPFPVFQCVVCGEMADIEKKGGKG